MAGIDGGLITPPRLLSDFAAAYNFMGSNGLHIHGPTLYRALGYARACNSGNPKSSVALCYNGRTTLGGMARLELATTRLLALYRLSYMPLGFWLEVEYQVSIFLYGTCTRPASLCAVNRVGVSFWRKGGTRWRGFQLRRPFLRYASARLQSFVQRCGRNSLSALRRLCGIVSHQQGLL